MSRRGEPNASYYSARYAERKMAQRRAQLEKPRQQEPCRHCGKLAPLQRIYCDACDEERMALFNSGDREAYHAWERDTARFWEAVKKQQGRK